MPSDPSRPCKRFGRRAFLLGAGAGLVAGSSPLWGPAVKDFFASTRVQSPRAGRTSNLPPMPGLYPGRVIEVKDDASVRPDYSISQPTVANMLQRGMTELTGYRGDQREAWRRFFQVGDVIGIKVNPVGRRALPTEGGRVAGPGSISNPELVIEIVKALKGHCGIAGRDIIVFDRYADEFRDAGYEAMMRTRDLDDVRWHAASYAYDDQQLRIDGQSPYQSRDPHIVGYDPDIFVSMGFAPEGVSPRDERRHRSHLNLIVSRMVNKVITLPCLKDHKSAGVTLALKNMSHGMNNNVARSHLAGIYRPGGGVSGPNQCNTFIPTAVNQPLIKDKMALHILDGLIGVYEGGPGNWNRSWGVWPHKALFFATDPVAMDHVGWAIIDRKRAEEGWAPVGNMGLVQEAPNWTFSPRLAALATQGTPEASAQMIAELRRMNGFARGSEPFDRRQPEHVTLAGTLALGRFQPGEIEHRVVRLG